MDMEVLDQEVGRLTTVTLKMAKKRLRHGNWK